DSDGVEEIIMTDSGWRTIDIGDMTLKYVLAKLLAIVWFTADSEALEVVFQVL
ncbi:unnamed protein product, partial [Symbiodinium sp. CCMP2592]